MEKNTFWFPKIFYMEVAGMNPDTAVGLPPLDKSNPPDVHFISNDPHIKPGNSLMAGGDYDGIYPTESRAIEMDLSSIAWTEDLRSKARTTQEVFGRQARALMSPSIARMIQELWKQGATYRYIAREISNHVNGTWGSNQIMGGFLVDEAADLLGVELK